MRFIKNAKQLLTQRTTNMAAKEFIVAIELGSSKITGIAGRKSMDGSIQVLAVVREDATSCIRKGVVYNIDKTCACLTNIINKLKAQLKIAQLSQEEKLDNYVQTVINAGNQVNGYLADCQVARDKDLLYNRQVEVLQDACTGTHELMNSGKASYLEVLTAQESLLTAQLNEASNLYDGAQALIALYISLGGGGK